ncbi:MAG: glycosyltransferase family 4 protein, partial [Nitrospirota bacterium]
LFKRYFVLGLPFMAVEKFYPRLFGDCICVSEASRQRFGIRRARVISNGINESLLDAAPADGDYISFVGRLHIHNKGLDTLVKAMAAGGGSVAIAGRGRDEGRLRDMVDRAGLGGKIRLAGYLDENEKARLISESRMFVLPSRYEGQGIVVLEAAACGKPVIVSDIPELSFAVEAGFGISFKAGDHKDLAEQIGRLWEDEGARRQMSRRAREYAKAYTWEKIAAQYEGFLVEAAKGAQ